MAFSVSMDLTMHSGLLKDIRNQFGHVQDLFEQRKEIGEVAILTPKELGKNQYVYYMMTKLRWFDKSDIEELWQCVKGVVDHALEHDVKVVCFPRIGAGFDSIPWVHVYQLIHEAFEGTGVKARAYMLPRVKTEEQQGGHDHSH